MEFSMIRTVLMLHVSPTRVEEVVELYRSADILQYSLDHSDAIRSELSVSEDGSGVMMVTALWPSADAYQGWLDNPWRASSGLALREILDGVEVGAGAVFQIRQSVTKDSKD
jgi:hypothetical protein